MNSEQKHEIKYLTKSKDAFFVEKKISISAFLFQEFFVFYCITLGSYFAIFISSQNFLSETSFSKSFNLVFDFFTIGNLINTSIGLFIVMGILNFINQMLLELNFNIQPIIKRLSTAITDFYYLMFSTILGCMLGLFHFLNNFPTIKDYEKLHNIALQGILTIGLVGTITVIAIQFLMHKNKVKI